MYRDTDRFRVEPFFTTCEFSLITEAESLIYHANRIND